jgi:hypothetical protein
LLELVAISRVSRFMMSTNRYDRMVLGGFLVRHLQDCVGLVPKRLRGYVGLVGLVGLVELVDFVGLVGLIRYSSLRGRGVQEGAKAMCELGLMR